MSIGDHEFIRAEASIEGTLDPDETIESAFRQSWKTVSSQVIKKVNHTRTRLADE
jgi:hypothetical protein